MTTTPGTSPKTILLDSDGLIAFFKIDDPLHARADELVTNLEEKNWKLYIAPTIIAEAMTTFQRRFDSRNLAERFYDKVSSGSIEVVVIDREIIITAYKVFMTSRSKKNTIFDAINIAVVRKLDLDAIFSFDTWYKKHSVKLAAELL